MPDPDPATAGSLLNTYYAYYGRYNMDVAHKIVRHFVERSLYSGEEGKTFTRRYALNGDQLTLETEPVTIDGNATINRLVWKRISTGSQQTPVAPH